MSEEGELLMSSSTSLSLHLESVFPPSPLSTGNICLRCQRWTLDFSKGEQTKIKTFSIFASWLEVNISHCCRVQMRSGNFPVSKELF